MAFRREFVLEPPMPFLVGREGREVERLEGFDDFDGELRLSCEGVCTTTVITSMPKFLTHETVSIVSVVESFCDRFILFKVSRPTQVRPAYARNRRMWVSSFARVKVSRVIEQVPFYCADDEGLAGLGVAFGPLKSWVSDEDWAYRLFNVL